MLSFYTKPDLFFYKRVKQAQRVALTELDEDIEFYIVQLMSSLTDGIPAELQEPLFQKVKNSVGSHGVDKYLRFKDLGDTCLVMLAGFPDFITGKGLSVNYYRDMGIMGYSRAGDAADRYLDGDFAEMLWKMSDKFYKIELVLRTAQGPETPGTNVEGLLEDIEVGDQD